MMRLIDLKPSDLSPDLRRRVEKVMRRQKKSWTETLDFLGRRVVSLVGGKRMPKGAKNTHRVVSP